MNSVGTNLGQWRPSSAQLRMVIAAGAAFGVTAETVFSRCRLRPSVRARFAACWAVRARWPRMTMTQLAMVLGYRDHSTVCHALRRAAALRAADSRFREVSDALASGGCAAALPIDEALVARVAAAASVRRILPAPPIGKEGEGTRYFNGVVRGSGRLLEAIRREHPARVAESPAARPDADARASVRLGYCREAIG